jgi:hypothetical protein
LTLGSDNTEPGSPALSPEIDEARTAPERPVEVVSATEPIAPSAAEQPSGGRLRRTLEWFTRRHALRQARAEVNARVQQPASLLAAFSSLELAESCLRDRAGRKPDYPSAAEAGRRAVILALCACSPIRTEASSDVPQTTDVNALFEAAPKELLESADPGEMLSLVRDDAIKHDFRTLAELSPDESETIARRMIAFARNLATRLEEPQHRTDRLVCQRFIRLGATLLVLVVTVTAFASDLGVSFRDLAEGKTYRSSSTYGNGGCRSPEQSCAESPFFFFHTVEEEKPWVEIDLARPTEISELIVKNRSDCCADRAVPLIVEVSTKRSRWKTVARIDATFDEWNPSFPPVEARYVRLKATRKTLLHLERVRILP